MQCFNLPLASILLSTQLANKGQLLFLKDIPLKKHTEMDIHEKGLA